jgi:hypothetical protein
VAQPSNDYPAVYPDTTNTTTLTSTVRVTLNTTLANNQNRHPLPMPSRGLPYSRSRPRECLHLEH